MANLVLTRRRGEQLKIGDMVLTVLRVQGGKVRLAVEGPREVTVLRGELERRPRHSAEPVE